jgi:hypothetical protein
MIRHHQQSATGLLRGPVVALAVLLLAVPLFGASASRSTPPMKEQTTTILGVTVGTRFEQAREKLNRAALRDDDENTTGRKEEMEDEEEGGTKTAWTFAEGPYRNVALKTDRDGRVVWITGFVRPGKEIAFSELGDASTAARVSDSEMIWNWATPNGNRRLIAKGRAGKATLVTIISTDLPPVE